MNQAPPPGKHDDPAIMRGFAPNSPDCPKCGAPPSEQVVRQWSIYPGDAEVFCNRCGSYVREWNSG